ncbi:MAG: hypothetical protein HY744_14880 [Deltaproteobacteria bacterium]|nr:hypothetical protein [Deltaproteobacteria bacterium]
MKKAELEKLSEGHLGRYDWSRAKRGRLAARASRASALLRLLDTDLAARFPDSKAVNDALRALLALEAALPRRAVRRRRAA